MNRSEILNWLREEDPSRLGDLYGRADAVRRATVGDEVHLRGLIEIGNACRRSCLYCGMRRENHALERYRMTPAEIFDCAKTAVAYGYGTVVLQAAEDPEIDAGEIADLIRKIKRETSLAVTLGLGEREEDFGLWRDAGADRYLLRFETSDRGLYERIHPAVSRKVSDRLALLRSLRTLGYEIGGGVMIGLPGQTWDILADDLLTFRAMDLDMVGVGPYLAHPETPLGKEPARFAAPDGQQVPNSEEMTYKVIALTRLLCPEANIPSTTALATVNRAAGRERGLQCGANVVMPNLTPPRYRELYEIYPGKACLTETAEVCRGCLRDRIAAIGRTVGSGPGARRRREPRLQPA
jgi:biotin synthase